MGFGLKEARETVADGVAKLKAAADDTKTAVTAAAAIAVIALAIGLVALVMTVKARHA